LVKKDEADAGRESVAVASAEYDVLIVDDDQRTACALAHLLADAGFAAAVLHTGKEAMRHVETERVSAAIVDVHLPDLNGLVLSMSLREKLGPKVPIFVVSGDTSMETINSLPHVGATHFFAKPLSPGYLIERLRASLSKAEGSRQNAE
jgi:DNA-binding response OmpR family regulator